MKNFIPLWCVWGSGEEIGFSRFRVFYVFAQIFTGLLCSYLKTEQKSVFLFLFCISIVYNFWFKSFFSYVMNLKSYFYAIEAFFKFWNWRKRFLKKLFHLIFEPRPLAICVKILKTEGLLGVPGDGPVAVGLDGGLLLPGVEVGEFFCTQNFLFVCSTCSIGFFLLILFIFFFIF